MRKPKQQPEQPELHHPETPAQSPKMFELQVKASPLGVFQTFSNNVGASWTGEDLRLRFGEMAEVMRYKPADPRIMQLEERVSITMTWFQAKALRDLLNDIIAKYENLNGEIKQQRAP